MSADCGNQPPPDHLIGLVILQSIARNVTRSTTVEMSLRKTNVGFVQVGTFL
jgi:hypothetical protein